MSMPDLNLAAGGAVRQGGLVGALSAYHDPERPEHDLEVASQRPGLDVVPLEADDLFEVGDQVSSVHLPRAREPWYDAQSHEMAALIVADLARQRRAWADERHVSSEHVEQLRQLIEAEPAQKATDPRDSRIASKLEQPRIGVVVEMRDF